MRTAMTTVAFLLVAVSPAMSQGGLGGNSGCPGGGSFSSGRSSATEFVVTYTFPQITFAAIVGAPYSGRQTTHTVRNLANGTHLTQPDNDGPMMHRDSTGRTRMDEFLTPPVGLNATPRIRRLAQIDDPVAGYRYILDSVHQIAYRVVTCTPTAVRALAAVQPAPPGGRGGGDDDGSAEDLGTSTMFGVTVTGKRQTRVFTVGAYSGNDAPVTVVNETWHSQQYGLDLLSKNTRPEQETTSTMVDFTAGDPDPARFRVPPGYQVVDKNSEFTITIPYSAQ